MVIRIGKVFEVDELREIGNIAKEHNLIILADEVVSGFPCSRHILLAQRASGQYDCLALDREHIRIATLDDFWERTITFGSAVCALPTACLHNY